MIKSIVHVACIRMDRCQFNSTWFLVHLDFELWNALQQRRLHVEYMSKRIFCICVRHMAWWFKWMYLWVPEKPLIPYDFYRHIFTKQYARLRFGFRTQWRNALRNIKYTVNVLTARDAFNNWAFYAWIIKNEVGIIDVCWLNDCLWRRFSFFFCKPFKSKLDKHATIAVAKY